MMSSWSAPVLPACTCCIGCASRDCRSGSMSRAVMSGGTWYWNRYPGARCDIESMQYSYSFSNELQQEWEWRERYAPQPEILNYANHVADRFNLRPDIQFDTRRRARRVGRAYASLVGDHVRRHDRDGDHVILATGCLSNARMPDIKGLPDFKGPVYHTGHWPHDPVDFYRPARRRDRYGIVGDPVGACDCGAGQTSDGVSAYRELLDPRPQRRADAGRARFVSLELSGDPAHRA